MADDEKTDPAPPEDEKIEKAPPEEQRAALKSQILAMFTLIAVFGLLFVIVKILPSAGDKLVDKIQTLSGSEKTPTTITPTEKPVKDIEPITVTEKKPITAKAPAPEVAKTSKNPDQPISEEKVRTQILEALGGAEQVEVRHVAFSEDKTRMITSLKLTPKNNNSQLIELLFQRDEFGRYISAENSPLDAPITIWK